ncbi:ABC transporter ATP-binding protein [Lichenihabitans sp. Uapishka_5]|uniref:ABC transporter ATP-binding protein n=1 Tax=Lichenihabitans sp. Uapishka_5 TaxID=3037302 RepID=UPI0029E80BBE|nr:ABC transporter ATP-binding protein [Lichenihabitans sp. Uapishka_5]MDX7949588.1 ABC transporter ATP-binding protein [Lichenihabitans sp. Uapishka_5]
MIAIEHLSRRFGDALAVDDVSMVLARGTITAVVGTSGSGKSTLLRMINRLIEPSAGTVRIDGRDTADLDGETLRRGIGYVIQGHGLFPHWTVARNIATVPTLLGWDRERIEARVRELMQLLRLDHAIYADKRPHQLSGGQQQRVGVARALAAEPAVLLMDEPFGALDPVIRGQAQADLLALQKRLGTTVVLVTHDMEEAIHLGDSIAVMDGGRLLQHAAPAVLLAAPQAGFVERLVGTGERPFRLLSLRRVGDLAQPGDAPGQPLRPSASLRDALSELLWRRQDSLPVAAEDGSPPGRITLAAILAESGAPSHDP